jgi:hypothetical protein
MKNLNRLFAVVATVGALLYGCAPDPLLPEDNGASSLSGAVGDPHPALDVVCATSDPLYLIREDDKSTVVNKCYGMGGIPTQCPPGQLSWGNLIMVEGYYQNINYLDCNFSLAPGWYCVFDNWKFGIASDFTFDNNGTPIVGVDWGTQIVAPEENQWQLRIPVAALPSPCFDVALRVHAVKLNLFGFQITGSQTILWGQNSNWNVTGHPAQSVSPFLMHFCPERCLEGPPPPQDTTLTGGNCQGCQSSNTVTFNTGTPNCVSVTSCKNLSNVVLRDCNGVNYKFDGLHGKTGTFCHPSGLPVTRVYVKSGCFQSGEGPGYGRRFNNPFDVCL